MAGRDVEIVAVDDELKPDGAVTKVKGLLERDKVDFVVGPIFSNILQAIHKPVTDTKTFLISPNAGPSSYAGKNCSPFFYVTSYQNDQVHEILGKVAQGPRLQARLPDGSELSGRPGFRGRVQTRLQGGDRRGDLHAAGFAGFPGRTLQDRIAETRTPCLPSCRAAWASRW